MKEVTKKEEEEDDQPDPKSRDYPTTRLPVTSRARRVFPRATSIYGYFNNHRALSHTTAYLDNPKYTINQHFNVCQTWLTL